MGWGDVEWKEGAVKDKGGEAEGQSEKKRKMGWGSGAAMHA